MHTITTCIKLSAYATVVHKSPVFIHPTHKYVHHSHVTLAHSLKHVVIPLFPSHLDMENKILVVALVEEAIESN